MRPETQKKKRELNFIYKHLINKLVRNTIFSHSAHKSNSTTNISILLLNE